MQKKFRAYDTMPKKTVEKTMSTLFAVLYVNQPVAVYSVYSSWRLLNRNAYFYFVGRGSIFYLAPTQPLHRNAYILVQFFFIFLNMYFVQGFCGVRRHAQ